MARVMRSRRANRIVAALAVIGAALIGTGVMFDEAVVTVIGVLVLFGVATWFGLSL